MKKSVGTLLATLFLVHVSSIEAMEDKELNSAHGSQSQQSYAEEMYGIGQQCLTTAIKLLDENLIDNQTIEELIQIQTDLALDCFQKASDSGHQLAPYDLALIYHNNLDHLPIAIDLPKAINLYKQAEAREHYGAVVELAYIYQEGNGILQNYQEALKRLLKLIEMGDTMAFGEVGKYYFNGWGTSRDYKTAAEYFYRSILKDNEDNFDATLQLVKMYKEGLGVVQDLSKAGGNASNQG